ncbi:MAG TPA: hypothetical protein VJJ22_03635 [Candidatus Paceibacterota bacterium]
MKVSSPEARSEKIKLSWKLAEELDHLSGWASENIPASRYLLAAREAVLAAKKCIEAEGWMAHIDTSYDAERAVYDIGCAVSMAKGINNVSPAEIGNAVKAELVKQLGAGRVL